MNKKNARIKRATKVRKKLYKLGATRLVVHRTCKHIYAQIISKDNSDVLVTASTTEKLISSQVRTTSNKKAAAIVGKIIAERATKKNITNVSFDRSGFKYHGRVQTLANYARQAGLIF
ncbi:50S ribosomal protein L18 [Blochmannia endosymbiont of Camponotus sp.]|uniref:50S ribosomal protein L18 n=1 Tax=Blochmannia endosymbiont of Camponotus sp. TaxID=700220 RepID=UPI0020253935|nr:50S ribosomal protein L18 [Blochmannia endosymbiont of Camponotus sp.]URJ30164.1 50S ribosomal protein L18 [Blochmannia endosymbiont of Camponotus sp.]URJ30942.1 50S ribosomal protein L18 [Blochmannia endosymbiont of Camponotus sp.]